MAFSSAHRWWDGLIWLFSAICAPSLGGSPSYEHLCADGPAICWLLPELETHGHTDCLIDTFTWGPAGRSRSEHPSGTHRSSPITEVAYLSPRAKTERSILGSLRVLLTLLSELSSGPSLSSPSSSSLPPAWPAGSPGRVSWLRLPSCGPSSTKALELTRSLVSQHDKRSASER